MNIKRKEKNELPDCLTREDVFDHISSMRKNGQRFVVTPNIKERSSERGSDQLRCGGHCYGIMFESGGSIRCFILRMNAETAKRCGAVRAESRANEYGDDWYVLTANGSFKRKERIYWLLDDCYDYTLRACYTKRRADDGTKTSALRNVYAK